MLVEPWTGERGGGNRVAISSAAPFQVFLGSVGETNQEYELLSHECYVADTEPVDDDDDVTFIFCVYYSFTFCY